MNKLYAAYSRARYCSRTPDQSIPDIQSSLQQNDRSIKMHAYKNKQSRMTVGNDQYPGRRRCAVITADSMLKVI